MSKSFLSPLIIQQVDLVFHGPGGVEDHPNDEYKASAACPPTCMPAAAARGCHSTRWPIGSIAARRCCRMAMLC